MSCLFCKNLIVLGWIGFAVTSICPEEYKSYADILKLHPLTSLAEALFKFIGTARFKYMCEHCPDVPKQMNCPGIISDFLFMLYLKAVLYSINSFCLFLEILKSSYFSELKNILTFLGVAWVVWLILIILKDYGIFSLLWNRLNSLYLGHIEASNLRSIESDVAKEKDRVDASLSLTGMNLFISQYII